MRVLLIEDDSATAQSIELMLQSEGFNVYTTDLGELTLASCTITT
jgi:two-component system cell cycle response regulator CtrA